jgi:hypothetical protein
MTGLPVEHRFENHKHGYKSAWVVQKYGVSPLPELFAHLNPMPYEPPRRWKWNWRKTCARKVTLSPVENSSSHSLTRPRQAHFFLLRGPDTSRVCEKNEVTIFSESINQPE